MLMHMQTRHCNFSPQEPMTSQSKNFSGIMSTSLCTSVPGKVLVPLIQLAGITPQHQVTEAL